MTTDHFDTDTGKPPSVDPFDVNADDDFIFYLQRGGEALRAGRSAEARIALERAYALRPDNARAQNMLGLAYFKLGLLEASRSIYDALLEKFPKEPALWVNQGLVLLRQGRLDEAEEAFKTALALSPTHTRAHSYMGLLLYRRQELDQAKEHFLRAGNKQFAERIEQKLRSGDPESDEDPSELLDSVVEEGVARLEREPQPLRSLAPGEEAVSRDEDAWQTRVGHEGPPESEGRSFESPSLISMISGPAQTEGIDGLVAMMPPPIVADTLAGGEGFEADANPGPLARLSLKGGSAFARRSRLLGLSGKVTAERIPARKGKRGLSSRGDDPFVLLSGTGEAVLDVAAVAVALRTEQGLIVREDALVGFTEGLEYSRADTPRFAGVLLAGQGSALLCADARPVLFNLTKDQPQRVLREALLACGRGVEVAATSGINVLPDLVELSGSGFVMLSRAHAAPSPTTPAAKSS